MEKPTVPSHLIPSAIVYCDEGATDRRVRELMQRSKDARLRGDWPAIIAIQTGIGSLPRSVHLCQQAVSKVYLGDLAWAANQLATAKSAYTQAEDMFRLSSDREDRHNEAAAVYGQGLACHAAGDAEQAQRRYDEAFRLFEQVKKHWASVGNTRRFDQCVEVSTEIDRLGKICMDSIVAPTPPGPPPSTPPRTPSTPVIVSMQPDGGASNVAVDQAIEITFSQVMDPDSFQDGDYEISPAVATRGVKWNSGYRHATIQHDGFRHSQTYSVALSPVQAQKTDASTGAKKWTFTTQARSKAVIRNTWPSDGEVDVPLNAPVIVQCSPAIQDVRYAAKPALPEEKAKRRWLQGKTIQIDLKSELDPGQVYEVTVHEVTDDRGNLLPIDHLSSVPNPWRFTTMTGRLQRGEIFLDSNLAFGVMLSLSGIAAFGVFLLIQLGWAAAGAYVLAWLLATITFTTVVRRKRIIFSLASDEEAIVDRNGQLEVMAGQMLTAWRWPVVERLRAIVPMRLLTLRVADIRFVNDYKQQMSLGIHVQYKVNSSIKAFCSFLEAEESNPAGTALYKTTDLQVVLDRNLQQVLVPEVQKNLKTLRKEDLERYHRQIEIGLVPIINLHTCRCGIEVQDVRLIESSDH